MKRLKVTYQQGALGDLQDIYRFLRERGANPVIARGYIKRIRATCDRIGDAARSGHARDDLEPGLRTWSFERRAVIAYKVVTGSVAVTNIFYAGRNVDAFYRYPSRRFGDEA